MLASGNHGMRAVTTDINIPFYIDGMSLGARSRAVRPETKMAISP